MSCLLLMVEWVGKGPTGWEMWVSRGVARVGYFETMIVKVAQHTVPLFSPSEQTLAVC